MFYIYIIKSEEGKFYIGETDNIEKRLNQHNSKEFRGFTSGYNNWLVIYSESFATKKEALIREKEIKSYKGGYKFKKLVNVFIAE
ncbi:MAG: GIY-YIG nuclease family protein [Candidatus Gracilibacteria bacterium]|nr:GIY-YIG nuclease family protein [Candidatus Gracilibacteria bacterium]MDD2908688.1 GIY-YIG nuclease family protein [Candidatus Gracilibacteria bacterium]